MSIDLIPTTWKLAATLVGVLGVVACLAGVAAAIEKHGHDAGAAQVRAELQPKLDLANKNLGVLQTANDTNNATIRALQEDQHESEVLQEQYEARLSALNQQASDTAAAIRKLQSNDQNVAAYLSTPIPDALRGLLNDGPDAGDTAGAGH